jgi:hypothetical protein
MALAGAGAALADRYHWPLDRPVKVLTGGFGEPRAAHFHAGLDLSTGRVVGTPALAPAAVWVERVRVSGSGYGRALYMRTAAGETFLFGHLDAYAPRIAAYVDSVQVATGQYEQDLWFHDPRFRFAAGEVVGWSGQSGAGPPHFHMELRHGDFSLSPLLHGFSAPDTVAPRIAHVVLEPVDERSTVQRMPAPFRVRLDSAFTDTLVVQGRVRVWMMADDAADSSAGTLPVRAMGVRWQGRGVECRMDSISWDGEMIQGEWLLDRGRLDGRSGVLLDAPARYRPRFLVSDQPDTVAVKRIDVPLGAPPRPLEVWATDPAGNRTLRSVWLRGANWREESRLRDGPPAAARAVPGDAPPRWTFAVLPDQRLRIRVTGAPVGLRDVRFERASNPSLPSADASWDGAGWTAVLNAEGLPDPDGLWMKATGADGREWWNRGAFALWPTASSLVIRHEDWAWFNVPVSATVEPGLVLVRPATITGLPEGSVAVRAALEAQPARTPLLQPVRIQMRLPQGVTTRRTAICRRDAEGQAWDWLSTTLDSLTGMAWADATHLGQFAVVRDEAAPRVDAPSASRVPPAGPYPAWELTAAVSDSLSGVDARASALVVDGVRVPTEWDAEAGVLRWRPLVPPTPGEHRARVEAVDRAGNATVREGLFVLDSAPRP